MAELIRHRTSRVLPLDFGQTIETYEAHQKLQTRATTDSTEKGDTVRSSAETKIVDWKYAEIWTRVRRKIKGAVYLSLLCNDLRIYGTSSFLKGQNINYKRNVEQLLIRLKSRRGEEQIPEQEKVTCIIHPNSTLKKYWNLIIVFLLFYTALIMPYRLAFTDYDSMDWFTIERVVDGLFFTDVLLTCFTAVERDDGSFECDNRVVFCKYLRTWLVLDLVACVPFSLIGNDNQQDIQPSNGYNNLLRLVRLPRLYRLLRITRLYRLVVKGKLSDTLERLQDCLHINRGMSKVFYFSATVLVSLHVSGCLWYYMAKLQGFGPDTWVTNSGFADQSDDAKYIAGIYWACYTLTTVGYGDIVGRTDIERLYSIIWMSFSIAFYSFTIGSLSSVLSQMNSRDNSITLKLNAADQMVREGRLSEPLKAKLRRAIRVNSRKAELDTGDKQLMFDALPKQLRYEVASAMYGGVADKIPFFEGRSPEFISTIIPYLRYSYLDSGDFVYRINDDSDELYIILKGRVTFVLRDEAVVFKSMLEGSYFGDVEVIFRSKRLCSSCLESDGELLVMSKPMLKCVENEFPEVYQEMEKLANERWDKILTAKAEVEEALGKLQDPDSANPYSTLRTQPDTATPLIPQFNFHF